MGVFSSETITRLSKEGEDLFNLEHPSILDRISLEIVEGTSQYELPDYVMNINRITWKGRKLEALNHRDLRNVEYSATSQGTPYNYVFNNIGRLRVQFFPTPNESIERTPLDLWGSEIPNRVIVQFWRSSDYNTNVIPPFFSRRMLKSYALSRLYTMESKGQNLKAANYWTQKWLFLKDKYSILLTDLQVGPRRTTFGQGSFAAHQFNLHLPISRFGISVNEGE